MVAVIDTETGSIIRWTGKSYPMGRVQEQTLVHAPLESHLLTFNGAPMLILGCHDLNLFSERARASQLCGSIPAQALQQNAETRQGIQPCCGAAASAYDGYSEDLVHSLGWCPTATMYS